MSEWRDIESAPNDQIILVYGDAIRWRGTGGVCFGYVHSDYNGHKRGVITLDAIAGPIARDGEVTHYMPLPAPPSAPKTVEQG